MPPAATSIAPDGKPVGWRRAPVLGLPAAMLFAILTAPVWGDEAAAPLRPLPLPLVEQWPLKLPAHHVQGLAVSDSSFWISTVDRAAQKGWVFRVDRESLQIKVARDVTIKSQYHPGGIQLVGGALWVPVAEYRPRSTTTVLKLDPSTLETLGAFACDDHLGAIAADGKGTLYAFNWDARLVYVFDEQGQVQRKLDNPTGVAYQDVNYDDGMLYGCGRATVDGKKIAVVDALDPKTCALKMRYALQGETLSGGANFSREGLAKLYDDFYLLPEDGPKSAVYRFAIPQQ